MTNTKQSPAGGEVMVSKLLRAMATGTMYKDVGHDIILNKAADLIDAYLAKITAIEADRDTLQSDKDRMTKALEEIVGMTYAGAPDIYMKRIARAALSPPITSQSEGEG